MPTRIGINGFGRMGRLILRAGWSLDELEFVHINDPFIGLEGAAHLLEFDSVHGRWQPSIGVDAGQIHVADKRISFSEASQPADVAWRDYGVDIVLECSGKFRTTELLQPYLDHGVKKVIVSAPVKTGVLNIVMGCNDDLYNPAEHHIICLLYTSPSPRDPE